MSVGDTGQQQSPGLQPGITRSETGGQTQSVTGPNPLQAPYIEQLLQEAGKLFGQPSQLYPGSFNATPSQKSTDASRNLFQQGTQSSNLFNQNVPGALQFGLGDVLGPGSNPYLAQYGSQLTDQLAQDFERSILPTIRSNAAGSGNAQSTRRGIAEGVAASDLTDTVQRAQTDLYNRAYGQGLNTFSNTLSQLPGLLQAGGIGPQQQAASGAYQDQLRQQPIDELIRRHTFGQLEPASRLAQFQNFITGPYGSQTNQTNTGQGIGTSAIPTNSRDFGTGGQPSLAQNIFGGALGGLGQAPLLGSTFGLGGPAAGGLGILGGILGSLF